MRNKFDLLWLKASLVRYVYVMVECLIGMIVMGFFTSGLQPNYIIYSCLFAGSLSIIRSIAIGQPESNTNGFFRIDTNQEDKDIYRLDIYDDFETLSKKKKIILIVDNKADLSQKKQLL